MRCPTKTKGSPGGSSKEHAALQDPGGDEVKEQPAQRPPSEVNPGYLGRVQVDLDHPVGGVGIDLAGRPHRYLGFRLSKPSSLKALITLRTWLSSVDRALAMSEGAMPAAEASRIWARWRVAKCLAVRDLLLSNRPLSRAQVTDEDRWLSHRHLLGSVRHQHVRKELQM
jgi:hypothetical protein